MALYGVILHWAEHTAENGGHFPATDHLFISPDANEYLEVESFPNRDHDAYAAELRDLLDNGRKDEDGRRTFKPMRYVRRFFAQQEQRDGVTIMFDCRHWPPILSREDMKTGGLPEGTKYPDLMVGPGERLTPTTD